MRLCNMRSGTGMTPTDLIYPFFVFIMGVSAFFSLSKRYEGAGREAFSRILRRSAVIFGVGLLLQEISYFGYGTANFLSGQTPAGAIWFETAFPFRTFRIMGVLQGRHWPTCSVPRRCSVCISGI